MNYWRRKAKGDYDRTQNGRSKAIQPQNSSRVVSVAVENVTWGHKNGCSETQLARELGEKAGLYGIDYGDNKRCDCEACTRAYHAGYSDGLERL